jgi:SAM-dependent methyltransferase
MHENKVRSVTDLGCGDWQFSHLIDWNDITYTGFDIVPHLIDANRKKYSKTNISFSVFNSIENLPGGDLLLCKEVLQHLPNATVTEYLQQIRKKYRWALITNFVEPGSQLTNTDIHPGRSRPLRLELAPFRSPGAVVFTYYPQDGARFFKNHVFLMLGTL